MSDLNSPEIVTIAVMGATGVGKTTFVNLASNSNLKVGNDLDSCTSQISCSDTFELLGRTVQLIDTPGFDDSSVSDTQILRRIALYLETEYNKDFRLSGILYLHRISDVRMGGTARRNFSLFRKLCGEHGLQNVIIVTTRWADVPLETGLKREEQLRSQDNLFRPAIENGATLLRHDNTIQSAYDILEQLVRRQPVPLRIQMELVDEKKDISETAAGAELHRQLEEQAEKFEREIEELRREMNDALRLKDFRMETEIREAKEQFEVKLKQVAESRDKLSQLYAQEKQASEEMKKSIKALEDHQKRVEREHEEERQRHRAQIATVQGVHVDLSKAHEELAAAYSTQVGTMGNKLEELGEALVKEQEKTKQILNEERRVRERDERELQVKAETLKTKLEAERAESEKARAAMIEKERKREEELQKLRDNMREIESKLDRSRKEEQQKRDEEKKAREERKTTPLVSPLPPPPRSQSYQPSPPPPPRSQPPSPPESKGFFATIRSFFSS